MLDALSAVRARLSKASCSGPGCSSAACSISRSEKSLSRSLRERNCLGRSRSGIACTPFRQGKAEAQPRNLITDGSQESCGDGVTVDLQIHRCESFIALDNARNVDEERRLISAVAAPSNWPIRRYGMRYRPGALS